MDGAESQENTDAGAQEAASGQAEEVSAVGVFLTLALQGLIGSQWLQPVLVLFWRHKVSITICPKRPYPFWLKPFCLLLLKGS